MPATLPCPKMPKQPPKKRPRCPSRSTCCAARKRTRACAAVSLMAAMCALYDAPHAVSKLVVHSHEPDRDGCTVRVTAKSAGWRYVGFEVLRIGTVVRCEEGRETCVVVLSGRADLRASDGEWRGGGRGGGFRGPPARALRPPRPG